ncbi:MAG TPA: hypothetical protein VJB12_04620 [Candidatus Nanoarchaeia archaeon]|nr:hypothetical protein [Candidatus Nanoarchaeia archaeon]
MAKTPDDIHREILKEALKGKEEKPAFLQKSKKAIIIAMALFLILVTLIYLLPGTAIDYLRASFSTYTIEDSMIFLPQGRSIAFENNVYGELLDSYHKNQKTETKFCLMGSLQEDTYRITSLMQPNIYSQSFSHVSSAPCPQGTIIDLHTHPYKSCFFSAQDLRTYESVKAKNPDALLGMMCEKDRFALYGAGLG